MDEMVAGGEIRDPVLELIGVEVVDCGQVWRGAVESQLGLFLDASTQAVTMPSLLPAPEELASGLAERVEGADHDEVADRARADGGSSKSVEEIVEGGVGSMGALVHDRFAAILAEVADVVEADPHGVGHRLNRLAGGFAGIWLRQAMRKGGSPPFNR